ncbi:MAG: RtcB family protein [Candidatus Aminicenantes bacterium]|nr:RtcB family protein [Candidatus Aminicenantes bacterium]
MVELSDFKKMSPYRWVLEKEKNIKMKTHADLFANESMLKNAIDDGAINQVINVATLPGIVSHSIAMPDIHYGYGFCIGGVAAFPADSGIVLPGGVGYDINCGVRLLSTDIDAEEIRQHAESLGQMILRDIPTGLRPRNKQKMNKPDFFRIIKNGSEEIINRIGGNKEDLNYIESRGKLPFDSIDIISDRAIERGRFQVGSLGSGNHFIEIQMVADIYDPETAEVFGLKEGRVSLLIHTGSRGFGHQIATDYIERIRKRNLSRIKVADPQLIYAEIQSKEGKSYLQALNAASNFAWANRQMLMQKLISIFERVFHSSADKLGISLVYDQAHNIAKFETHKIGSREMKVLVHRKGATRAFPAGHSDIPEKYRSVGQPVVIPGSMGTASYVLKGTPAAMEITLGSSAHGAGRRMSRHQAIKFASQMNVTDQMKQKNIMVFSYSQRGLKEEIPEAYKDIDEVVRVTEGAGISEKVARLIPLVVVKG